MFCGLFAAILGVAGIYLLIERITAPIRERTRRANELASNRLEYEKGQSEKAGTNVLAESPGNTGSEKFAGDDEVSELATVFRLLDQRTSELQQANMMLEERNHEIDSAMNALQNTEEELVDNLGRLERELAAARQLQMGMVPSPLPNVTEEQPVDIDAFKNPRAKLVATFMTFSPPMMTRCVSCSAMLPTKRTEKHAVPDTYPVECSAAQDTSPKVSRPQKILASRLAGATTPSAPALL